MSGFVVAVRLARRDALRNKARTALTFALIGIPILLLGVADIGYRTYQLDPTEHVTRQIGSADAGFEWSAAHTVQQGPAGWLGSAAIGAPDRHAPSAAAVAALLPRGSRLIEQRVGADPLVFGTRAGLDAAPLIGLNYRDPIAAGLVTQRSGRAPRTPKEIVVTTALARADRYRIGDVVRAQRPARTFIVVGTVTDTSDQQDRALYTLPAAVPLSTAITAGVSLEPTPGQPGLTWLAKTSRPMNWDAVLRANEAGLLVLSRSVYLHPDAAALAADARLDASNGGSGRTAVVAILALIGGMALLEVILLAGPAFAVGAKRRRRDLALVAASGGSAGDIRRVVLAEGLVLGLAAGLTGAIGAVIVARLGLPFIRLHVARLPGAFDARPLDLLLLIGVGVLAAVLASIAPARAAGRVDVVAALSGRPAPNRIHARVPVAAVVLAAAGVFLALAGATKGGSTAALAILGGTALVEIAIIVCTPLLLTLAARGGRRLPLTARMALRDAGRNRSAATPAVAAVMASVVGATAMLIGIASYTGQQRRAYVPSSPNLTATANLPTDPADAQRVRDVLRATLPASSVAMLDAPDTVCTRTAGSCSLTTVTAHDAPASPGSIPPLVIDGGDAATALFGPRAAQARAALHAGKAVVARRSLLRNGKVRLDTTSAVVPAGDTLNTGRSASREVPAEFVATDGPSALIIVPKPVSTALDVKAMPYLALARLQHTPSDAQQQATLAQLRRVTAAPQLSVETGYHDPYLTLELALVSTAVAVAVLAALIATGLANVDARPDLMTLAAVGAAPRIRRVLSTARAAVIATLGTAVGVAAGFLAPAAWVLGDTQQGGDLRMVVPWPAVLGVASGVPLLAALLTAATTRARLQAE